MTTNGRVVNSFLFLSYSICYFNRVRIGINFVLCFQFKFFVSILEWDTFVFVYIDITFYLCTFNLG